MSDDFELVPERAHGPRCGMGIVMDGGRPAGSTGEPLTPDQCDRLAEWLADDTITSTRITETLRDRRGLSVGYQSVQRHRTGRCHCPS